MKKLIILLLVMLVGCQTNELPVNTSTENEVEISDGDFISTNLEDFYDELFVKLLLIEPQAIDSLGDLTDLGVEFQKDKLTIRDQSYYDKKKEILENALVKLDSYTISDEESTNAESVRYYINGQLEAIKFKKQDFFLGFITGEHRELYDLLLEIHTIDKVEDAENWLSRIEESQNMFDAWTERYTSQFEEGYYLDKENLIYTLSGLRNMYKRKITNMDLYIRFEKDVNALDIKDEEKQALIDRSYELLENVFVPGIKDFISVLEDEAQNNESRGVYHMPDGEAFYLHALKRHTTTDLTPEEVHQLGLSEVSRIQEDMILSLEKLAYSGQLNEMLSNLIRDDETYYGDAAMERYTTVASEMEAGLSDLFYEEDLPASSPDIRKSPGGNFYVSPSIDGKRAGVYYLDLNSGHSEFAINTLAYHETVPGHHLEREHELLLDIPMVRKLAFNTAYIEGWALYAEMLADEFGYNDTPQKHIGYLKSELHRAARLVVDTGIHYKKWTRQQAVDYLVDEGLLPTNYAQQEVTRYMSWPGQATSYKIGQLKLLELRNEMMEKQGDAFDIKEFHHLVLSNGSMPLVLLEIYFDELY